jgi:hypothetical protein
MSKASAQRVLRSSCGDFETPGHLQVALTTLFALPDCQASCSSSAPFCSFPSADRTKEAASHGKQKTQPCRYSRRREAPRAAQPCGSDPDRPCGQRGPHLSADSKIRERFKPCFRIPAVGFRKPAWRAGRELLSLYVAACRACMAGRSGVCRMGPALSRHVGREPQPAFNPDFPASAGEASSNENAGQHAVAFEERLCHIQSSRRPS